MPGRRRRAHALRGIVALADGSLGASLYSWPPVHGDSSAHFYQSRDDGRAWEPRSVIQRGDTNETAMLNVDGNRLLAAVRTLQARDVELFESDDAGDSSVRAGLGHVEKSTPRPPALADGRVLMVYGIRNQGLGKTE